MLDDEDDAACVVDKLLAGEADDVDEVDDADDDDDDELPIDGDELSTRAESAGGR